jgi:hypoxanthine phosphoribosyltransferase
MIEKHYITAQALLEDSYQLGAKIIESDFRPDFIVGIWRGGAPVGIAVQEMLVYFDITTDHISVRTSLYSGISTTKKQVRVHGLDYLVDNLNAENALLIVDDVFDSGRSIKAVIEQLSARTRRNTPDQIRVAAPWYKPSNNKTDRVPDYYVHTTDSWLVFPHEVQGLSEKELAQGKGSLFDIIKSVEPGKSVKSGQADSG